MPVTRDAKEQIEYSVNQAIINSFQNEEFIKKISNSVVIAVIKTLETRLTDLEDSVALLKKELDIIKNDNVYKITRLEETVASEEVKNKDANERLEHIDQANRLTSLRLFNMEEKQREDTKNEVIQLIKDKMMVNLKPEDIEFCYRIGTEGSKKRRGIYLKFSSLSLRQAIYGKKNTLKGTGIVIKEDLTKSRLALVNKLSDKLGLKNVWTQNGKIFVFLDKKVHSIRNLDDINKIKENQ